MDINLLLLSLVIPIPCIAYLCYINYRIYKVSIRIYNVSEALLDVNIDIYAKTKEVLEVATKTEEKL